MRYFSDSERGQIIAARLAEAFVKILHTLLGASRAKVYKVMSAQTNHGKGTSAKKNNWRNSTPTERDRLRQTFLQSHTTTAAQVTADSKSYHKNC
jgi:hypothetical protein